MLSLKSTLVVNSVSSAITGIGLVALAGETAQLFETHDPAPYTEAGLFLIGFAALVGYAAIRKEFSRALVRLITTLDILWMIGSILLILLAGSNISLLGVSAIAAVAIWVSAMAFLQGTGLRRMV
jgi:hypothetical protein